MKKFMFLLLGQDSHKDMSPEEGNEMMQKWMAWYQELGQNENLVDMGGPFTADGCRVSTDGVQNSVGHFTDGSMVGGWLIIQANDLADAAAIARHAPMLKGQAIEVREMIDMSGVAGQSE